MKHVEKGVCLNGVCCTLCNKWMHGRCTKMKKVTCSSALYFICRRCKDLGEDQQKPVEELCDEIETVKSF